MSTGPLKLTTQTDPAKDPDPVNEKSKKMVLVDLGNGSKVLHFPKFISCKDSWNYFQFLNEKIPWTRPTIRVFARSHLQPRDTCYVATYGTPQLVYSGYKPHAYSWDEFPPLKEILELVHKALPGSNFNSLLLNRYNGGNDYVGWHADDEKLYGPTPEIASVSFGCERDFLLKKKPSKPVKVEANSSNESQPPSKRPKKENNTDQHSFLLKHGSLLVMNGYTQRDWLHSVPKRVKAGWYIDRLDRMFSFAVRTRHASSENVGSPSIAASSPMFTFAKKRQTSLGSIAFEPPINSPNAEIDTRAPFQSVRDAVSLFREAVSPRSKPTVTKKSKAEERVLEKETQHNMTLEELDYYRDQLRSAERAKNRALNDMEKANKTMQQLTDKLEALAKSKQTAIKETEATKIRVSGLEEQKSARAQLGSNAWKLELDNEREQYKASAGELNVCKQEIASLKQDLDTALEAKFSAFQEAEEAEQRAKMNEDRRNGLLKEVNDVREALDQAKLATIQTEEEYLRLEAEKEALHLTYNAVKDEAKRKIERFKGEYEPEEKIARKLEETTVSIKGLEEQLGGVRASDLHSLNVGVKELHEAKEKLREVSSQENKIRFSVETLKFQMEEIKRERTELEAKVLEGESAIERMQNELEMRKSELESAKKACKYEEMKASLEKILADIENDRQEAHDLNEKAMSLKREAEEAEIETKDTEEKLQLALKQVEEAKAAEKLAGEKIHDSPKIDHGDLRSSGSNRRITLSVEEFETMNKKIEQVRMEADIKVSTAMAQVKILKANEEEALRKVEEVMKEKEIVQSETEDALKSAEMVDAVKKVVGGELLKWREAGECSSSSVSEANH